MFVGGEFYEDTAWVTDTPAPPIEDAIFLNGGRACLNVISDYLYTNKYQHILLPAYLCPSILDVLDQHALKYTFYGINEDFSINLDDLLSKADVAQVIYFINYFGFQHSTASLSVLRQLQSDGELLIEDNSHAVFEYDYLGDFCFNSIRKLCAYDGGYLATRNITLPSFDDVINLENHRLPLIREYRRQLRSYLYDGLGSREDLERLFYLAEHYYELDNVILGDDEERIKIEILDWNAIKAVRRDNFEYLLDRISTIPGIQPVFPALQADNMPLGLPIYISGFSRDRLIDLLAEESISLSVHWDALLSDPRTQGDPRVSKMAKNILTLPVDQYTSKSQLNFLVHNLNNILKK
ncbi:MAG: hypothetical protein C0410_10415 [Anaerolinea sp.]|nr:hypothetical protein [Anaerolinea sp.]